jgi:sulfide dehydrogenase [flavocytochrome c] flavoprotein subunit
VQEPSARRRALLGATAAAAAATLLPAAGRAARAAARVAIVGAGFAGASCARELRRLDPGIAVTLVDEQPAYFALPMSNSVIAGLRGPEQQRFTFGSLAAAGVTMVVGRAMSVDPAARSVILADGSRLAYDRLVLAPGIDLRWDAVAGYDRAAAERIPHAWKGAEQALLLRRQLQSMDDGGVVVIAAPALPMRCPPGPYERASLVAGFLKLHKPRSKLILLDAKDSFPRQALFQSAWQRLYPGLIEWIPFSRTGQLVSVDTATMTVSTDFDSYRCAVANIIAPQRAADIAQGAGVADPSGWCPIDPASFESKLQKHIHVIGDAAIGGAMPKSASGGRSQALACAAAIVALLDGRPAPAAELVSACYSLAAPDYGIAIRAGFRPQDGLLAEVPGSEDAQSAADEPALRVQDAALAEQWFRRITGEVFG